MILKVSGRFGKFFFSANNVQFLEPHLTEHLYYQFSLCSLMSIDPNNDFRQESTQYQNWQKHLWNLLRL